jgi:hypothetical protein
LTTGVRLPASGTYFLINDKPANIGPTVDPSTQLPRLFKGIETTDTQLFMHALSLHLFKLRAVALAVKIMYGVGVFTLS